MALFGDPTSMFPTIASLAERAIGAFTTRDPSRMTRADWDRVRLEEQRSKIAVTNAVGAGVAPAAAFNISANPQAVGATLARWVGVPQEDLADLLRQRAAAGQFGAAGVGGAMLFGNGNGARPGTVAGDEATLKDLLSMAALGRSDESIRAHARVGRFTYRDFTKLTSDPQRMGQVWASMGGFWADPANTFQHFTYLDKVNDALSARPKRRRREMSLKMLRRAGAAAQRVKKALRRLGILDSGRRAGAPRRK